MNYSWSNIKKPYHKYEGIECDAGELLVGIGINDIAFRFNDIEVGANTFKMGISHYYSNSLNISSGYYGFGYKLNIEQYIISYNTSYNIEGYNTGDYIYVDGEGRLHQFVLIENNRYYDVGGTNLKMEISTNGYTISDETEAKLVFNTSGRLIEMIQKGYSGVEIKKVIEYSGDKIVRFYDSRYTINQRSIKLEYSNNLLSKITLIYNDKEKESIYYKYDSNRLIQVINYVNNALGNVRLFRYTNNKLSLATSTPEGQAVMIRSSNVSHQINCVKRKVLLDGKEPKIGSYNEKNDDELILEETSLLGNPNYVGNIYMTSDIKGNYLYDVSSDIELKRTYYVLYDGLSTKITCNEVISRYYTNTEGMVLSSFEEYAEDLYTFNNPVGIPLQYDCLDDETETINKKPFQSISNTNTISLVELANGGSEAILLPTGHYKISFYLKNKTNNLSYLNVELTNDTNSYKVRIDPNTYESIQYVEIPVDVTSNNILPSTLKVVGSSSVSCEIADIRLIPYNTGVIKIDNYEYNISSITGAYLYKTNGDKIVYFQNNDYISLDDLKKNVINFGIKGTFDFIYSGGRKIEPNVTCMTLYFGSKAMSITNINSVRFRVLDYKEKEEAIYDYKYSSGLLEEHIYAKDISITNTTNEYYHSYTKKDLQGRVIESVDSYGKKTVNEYDDYGNLLSTQIALSSDMSGNTLLSNRKRLYLKHTYDKLEAKYRENQTSVSNEEYDIKYNYDGSDINKLVSVDSSERNRINYSYDTLRRITKVSSGNLYNKINYRLDGGISDLIDNNLIYKVKKDEEGYNVISINDIELFKEKENVNTVEAMYSQMNYNITKHYDNYDRLSYIEDSNGSTKVIYQYEDINDSEDKLYSSNKNAIIKK